MSGPILKTLLGVHLGLAVLFTLIVVTKKRDPAVTLAWVLGFFVLPFVSFILYMFFGYQRFRLRRRRVPNPGGRLAGLSGPPPAAVSTEHQPVETLARRLTEYPVTAGNRVSVFERGEGTNAALTQAIRGARRHIHMCYYIFEQDSDGIFYRDLLAERAREGVSVRLMMDGVGSFGLTEDFLEPLRRAGAQAAFFGPFTAFRRLWTYNFRNHRKLTVVDGEIGFLGSQNIGVNFWRVGSRRVKWRETDLRLEGPVVRELQAVFAEDWLFAAGENLEGPGYFPPPRPVGVTLAQALPTGPDRRENALALIFLEALHSARERITIATPYFVPTPPLVLALEGAARRGVRVELVVPRHSDHPLVRWAGRSWYDELLENGLKIYEFDEAFLHSKVVTVDGRLALVGSANMDTRSFLINFELSLLLYDRDTAGQLAEEFDRTIARSTPVPHRGLKNRSLGRNLVEGVCRMFSPLL